MLSSAAAPLVAGAAGSEAELAGTAIKGKLRGNLDYADWSGIKGWIWDPTEPDKRIALELLDGDNLLATVLASEYRADLLDAGIGDGRHGFMIGSLRAPYAASASGRLDRRVALLPARNDA